MDVKDYIYYCFTSAIWSSIKFNDPSRDSNPELEDLPFEAIDWTIDMAEKTIALEICHIRGVEWNKKYNDKTSKTWLQIVKDILDYYFIYLQVDGDKAYTNEPLLTKMADDIYDKLINFSPDDVVYDEKIHFYKLKET